MCENVRQGIEKKLLYECVSHWVNEALSTQSRIVLYNFFFYHLINSAQISRAFIHRIALTRLVLVVSINFKMKDKKDHWLQSAQKNIK